MNEHLGRRSVWILAVTTLKGGLRDRLLRGITILGLLFILSTAVFSSFSMRQTLEVAVNYSLSVVQIMTVLITLFLGLNLLSGEIESREGHPIIAQPIERYHYVLGKFGGLILLILLTMVILGVCSVAGVWITSIGMKNTPHIPWINFLIALVGIFLSCSIVGSVTLLFTSFATSAILPFLLTCAVYAIGQSTQPVKRFIESGMTTEYFSPVLKGAVKVAYYVFPNFGLFDFKVEAIYNLHPSIPLFGMSILYALIYIAVTLFVATMIFSQRDLP